MQEQPRESRRIGQLLVKEGVIDEAQLEQGLNIQAEQKAYKPLGEILRELGFVSRSKLRDVILKYQKQILLGELLVKMGVISESQLTRALYLQKHNSKKLGQILAENGLVTRSGLAEALCVQLCVSGIDKSSVVPDKNLFSSVNVPFLRRRRVMPLKYDKAAGVLTALVEDPTDKEAIADLGKIFKAEVEPVVLRSGNIEHLLDELLDMWCMAR